MTDSDVDKAQVLRNQAQELLGQAEVLELEDGIGAIKARGVELLDEIKASKAPMCPECRIPLENDNVDVMQWFCPNGYACKHVKKREGDYVAGQYSKIDGIIDHIIQYYTGLPAEWYIPEWNKEVITLVIFNGKITSGQMEKIASNNDITLNWDCSSCYMWVDTKQLKMPIYRNSYCNQPKNPRWKLERTVEVHLYFSINEVGLPKKWTKDIELVKTYATVHRRTR